MKNKKEKYLELGRKRLNDLVDIAVMNEENKRIEDGVNGLHDSLIEHTEKVATATEYGHVKVAERPPHEESESNGVTISAKTYGNHVSSIANDMIHGHTWLSDESGDKDRPTGLYLFTISAI